jgi:hypothetical protein
VTAILDAVREHLLAAFPGPVTAANVTFLGTEPLEILRFGPDPAGVVRYATVGVSGRGMHPPTASVIDPVAGPRAELILSLRPGRDQVLRALAVMAATPQVDGVVLAGGVTLDLQTPLWPGAALSAALLAEPGGLVADLDLVTSKALPPSVQAEPVRFHPLLPMTASEAALSRAKGAGLIQQLWLERGADLRDPDRRGVV